MYGKGAGCRRGQMGGNSTSTGDQGEPAGFAAPAAVPTRSRSIVKGPPAPPGPPENVLHLLLPPRAQTRRAAARQAPPHRHGALQQPLARPLR